MADDEIDELAVFLQGTCFRFSETSSDVYPIFEWISRGKCSGVSPHPLLNRYYMRKRLPEVDDTIFYTEIKTMDGDIIRASPRYDNDGRWYDFITYQKGEDNQSVGRVIGIFETMRKGVERKVSLLVIEFQPVKVPHTTALKTCWQMRFVPQTNEKATERVPLVTSICVTLVNNAVLGIPFVNITDVERRYRKWKISVSKDNEAIDVAMKKSSPPSNNIPMETYPVKSSPPKFWIIEANCFRVHLIQSGGSMNHIPQQA